MALITITGGVYTSKLTGTANTPIAIFEKMIGKENVLGRGQTNNKGQFEISFQYGREGDNLPDLQLVAFHATDQARIIGRSKIYYDVDKSVEMELILEEGNDPVPVNEFQDVKSLLTPHVPESGLANLREDDDKDDITYLAGKTGTDARLIAMTSLAHNFGQKNELPADAYYALFRAGLPTTEAGLNTVSTDAFTDVLKQAVKDNIIAANHGDKIKDYAAGFEKAGIKFALTNKDERSVSSLGDYLNLSLKEQEDKEAFTALYRQHQQDPDKLWPAASKALGEEKAKQLQLDGKLGLMTINNALLVQRLRTQGLVSNNPIELVQKGFYKTDNWSNLIANDIPIPAGVKDTKEYARLMSTQLRLSYPTAVLSQQIGSNELKFTDNAQVKEGVAGFLNGHQETFKIGKTPVARYIKDNKVQLSSEVVSGLKKLERVYQLSPSDKAMQVLLDNQLDSAFSITNKFDEKGFIAKFATPMGGENEAQLTYAKSSMVASAVMNVALGYGTYLRNPSIYAINAGHPDHENPADGVIVNPTLEELFGEIDYCECDHCRSVLSPAAYLVDLLKFADRTEGLGGKENPYEVLIRRRPDLEYIALTCENTNKILPYIDLVNEILEYYVVHGNLTAFKGYNLNEDDETADLLASAQFVDDNAYQTLGNQVYPMTLPFNLSLETLRAYFDHLKSPLWKSMQLLRSNDATAINTEYLGLTPQAYAILTSNAKDLAEYYGETAGTNLNTALATDNEYAKRLSRKLGITYKELVSLVKTQFLNPNAWLITKLEKLQVGLPVLLSYITSNGVNDFTLPEGIDASKYDGNVKAWLLKTDPARGIDNPARIRSLILITDPTGTVDDCNFVPLQLRYADNSLLKRIEYWKLLRFVRLWKTLGWTIEQTDAALAALFPTAQMPAPADTDQQGITKLNEGFTNFLLRLGQSLQVMDRLNLKPKKDLNKALAFWSAISTYGQQSLYRQLFLSPAVKKIDTVFEEDGYGQYLQDGTQTLTAHIPALLAALNTTEESLRLLITTLGLPDQLNLSTVSQLFRYAALSRALKISVSELLMVSRLTGITDIFADTIKFIDALADIKETGFKIPVLNYLFTHEDLSGKSSPPEKDVLAFARTVRGALQAVEQDNPEDISDATGELAHVKLALAYGETAAALFFGMIDGTTISTVSYDHTADTLENNITAISGSLSYDDFSKQLSFSGVMKATEQTAYKSLGIAGNFNNAIDELYARTRDLFEQLPALETLYQTKFEPLNTEERKAAYGQILSWLLPVIKPELKRLAIRQLVGSALGVEAELLIALLETPQVLHGVTPADALITDLNNMTPGTGFTVDEPVAGQLRYRTYVEAPATAFFNFYISTNAPAVAVTITGEGVAGTLTNGVWTNDAAIALNAGELRLLEIAITGSTDVPVVRWATATRAKEIIPSNYLYAFAQMDIFRNAYLRLLKSVTLIEKLDFIPEEVIHFARFTKTVGGNPVDINWLNALLAPTQNTAATIPDVFVHFQRLVTYLRLRKQLKIKGVDFIQLLQQPAAVNENGENSFLKASGWQAVDRDALLTKMGWTVPDMSDVIKLKWLADVVALLDKTGLQAALLLSVVTITPSAQTLRDLQAALRAKYETGAWREVIQPINDKLRTQQRDALVSYVLHQLSKNDNTKHINTADKLFEFFLIDVEMDSCMQTSRIKQAISSVQLFIHRCLLNLEKTVSPAALNARQWDWMKRYRVWEANRKVFLWPENWLEPELRDNKSSFFKALESELLQSDITEESAATAMLHYLEQLDTVAKLEICALHIQENQIKKKGAYYSADDIYHVFGRTPGANRKYYYRRFEYGYWTPWEKLDIDIEENPLMPVVWQDRLFLFWLNLIGKGKENKTAGVKKDPNSSKLGDATITATEATVGVKTDANLCWSEYFNGQWQPKRTTDLNLPIKDFGNEIDRRMVYMEPSIGPEGELVVNVWNREHLAFFNKQSIPETGGATPPMKPGNERVFINESEEEQMSITYSISKLVNGHLVSFNADTFTHDILKKKHGLAIFSRQETSMLQSNRWESPFFFQNAQHVFFVQPDEGVYTVPTYRGYGLFDHYATQMTKPDIPLLWQEEVIFRKPIDSLVDPIYNLSRVKEAAINPAKSALTNRFANANVNKAMAQINPVSFNGAIIGSVGKYTKGVPAARVQIKL